MRFFTFFIILLLVWFFAPIFLSLLEEGVEFCSRVLTDKTLMKFSALLSSFGLAFFLTAHLYFIPVADRMKVHHEKVEEKRTTKRFGEKYISTIFRQRVGFPKIRIFRS